MPLRMDFDESRLITLTSRHELFKGTRYEENDFVFKIKPMTRTELAVLAKRNTVRENGRSVLNTDAQAADVFCEAVRMWSGLEDLAGNEIECTAENRANITEHYIELASIVGAAALNRFNIEEIDKQADRKNSKGSGSGD